MKNAFLILVTAGTAMSAASAQASIYTYNCPQQVEVTLNTNGGDANNQSVVTIHVDTPAIHGDYKFQSSDGTTAVFSGTEGAKLHALVKTAQIQFSGSAVLEGANSVELTLDGTGYTCAAQIN